MMNDDLIKRSDAIAEIYKVRTPDVASHHYAELFINAVCRAPSADRPQGEWIDNGDRYFRCSLCGIKDTDTWNWCHGCGASMRPKLQGTHFDSIIIDECAMKGADDESVGSN